MIFVIYSSANPVLTESGALINDFNDVSELSSASTETFKDSDESKPEWMVEIDEYLKSDEIEFDFDTFFSKLTDAEFDDFTIYTMELALKHLEEITAEIL